MLVSKIKAIRNGRVIVKDSKTKDRNLVDINQERRRLEDKYEQALRDGDKGLAKIYSNRLEELRKEAIEAENKRDEERKNFGDSKTKDSDTILVANSHGAIGDFMWSPGMRIFLTKRPDGKISVGANSPSKYGTNVPMSRISDNVRKGVLQVIYQGDVTLDAVDPTKPKNIAAAKSLSVAQGKAASDGGPGSGVKGHKSAHHIPDPSTHKERRKERTNLQKYIENARRSGNIKEAQKHSQRLAHINSLQLKG